MIHTNRVVTVGENESIIDRPIVLYRGDREVEIEFELVGNEFMFSKEGNVIKTTNASHGQLVLNTPSGENMFSELAECHDGKVAFIVTKEMIDEFVEVGFYSFQIRLYDSAEQKSRVTLPPILNGFDIRNPIAAEDETNVVDQGIVDYARIFKDQSNEELPTFDWTGAYNKTEWVHHDVITENKLNKIEDALYSINANVKESDVVMLNTLDQVKKDADAYVKEHMAEVEADVDEFERNINTGVETFKTDTNAAMTAHKNEVSEVVDGFSGEIESINTQLTHKATKTRYDAVLDFGFDNTGNTNNSQKWYDLMEYSRNVKKIEVIFPPGTYLLSSRVLYQPSTSICENIKLIGENGAIIKFTGSVKNIALWFNFGTEGVTKPDFEFCGFEIDGTENGKWEGAAQNEVQVFPIKFDNCNYVNIHDNYIHDAFVGGGITVYRTNFCDIKNNRLINVYGCGNDSFGDAIYIGASTRYANVEGNYVYNDIVNTENNMGRCGIVYEFQTYSSTIKNNIIFGYDRAIHIEITKYNELITVESNKISGCNTGIMIWNTLSRIRILNNYITNENALLSKQKYTLGYKSGIICLEPMRCPRTEIIGNTVTTTYNKEWSPLKVLSFASTANGTAPDGTTKKFYAENFHVEENVLEDNYPIDELNYYIHMPMKSNFINNKIKAKKIRFGCNTGVKFINNDVDCTEFKFIAPDFTNADIYGNIDGTNRRPGFMANLKSEFISNKFYCSRDVKPDIRIIYLLGDFINNTILGWTSELLPYHTNNPTYCYGEISGNVFDSLGANDALAYGNAYGYTTKNPNKYIKKDGSIINHSYLASPILTSRGNIEVTLKAIPTVDTWIKGDRVINSNPTVGSPKSWICVEDGTPGTWVSEGNL